MSIFTFVDKSIKRASRYFADRVKKNGEIGVSGTQIYDGYITNDYLQKLDGLNGIAIYEKMRRSDSQIRAVLNNITLPIISTPWHIEPYKDENNVVDTLDLEKAKFVEKCLFKDMERTWEETLKEILSFLPFGFSVFEKVYKGDSKNGITLRKLAFRKQATIEKWLMSNGDDGIVQLDPQGKNIDIPKDKLLVFSYDREGDNYYGVSILRSVYQVWYYKQKFMLLNAVGKERANRGLVKITLPEIKKPGDKTMAREVVKGVANGVRNGVILPNSQWQMELLNLGIIQSADVLPSIEHFDKAIAKACLSDMIEIGTSSTGGSYALHENKASIVFMFLNSVCKQICSVINSSLIKELILNNWPDTENFPELQFEDIGITDNQGFATVLTQLVGAGVLTADPELENYAREYLSLPAKVKEEAPEEMPAEDGQDPTQELPDDSELEDMQTQLQSMLMSEIDESLEFGVKGQPLDDETKRKISEALKKRYGGKTVVEDVKQRRQKITDIVSKKGSIRDQYDSMVAPMRDQMANLRTAKQSIPKGKAGAQQRAEFNRQIKELLVKVKEMIAWKKAQLQPLEDERKKEKSIINESLSQLKAKRKATREQLKAKKDEMKKIKDESGLYQNSNYHEHNHPIIDTDYLYNVSKFFDNDVIIGLQKKANKKQLAELKKKGFYFNDYEVMAWRPLTFAERRVNLLGIKNKLKQYEEDITQALDGIKTRQQEEVLKQVKEAIANNDLEALKNIDVPLLGEMLAVLLPSRKDLFEYGKRTASNELGVDVPATNDQVIDVMRTQTDTVLQDYANKLKTNTINTVTQLISNNAGNIENTTPDEAVNNASKIFESVASGLIGGMMTMNTVGSLNLGRSATFELYPEKIYCSQYSAVIDDRTTPICLSLDGLTVEYGSEDYRKYMPPRHYNCRSIWVNIFKNDVYLPDITGINKRIPASVSLDDQTRLEAPIIKEGSAAIRQIQKEIKERERLIERYKNTGTYEQRIMDHQDKIEQLKQSLDTAYSELLQVICK